MQTAQKKKIPENRIEIIFVQFAKIKHFTKFIY